MESADDVHQCGLSGSVLAQDCQDFAWEQVQVDVSIGHNPWEVLGDPSHFKDGIGHVPAVSRGLMPQANPFG